MKSLHYAWQPLCRTISCIIGIDFILVIGVAYPILSQKASNVHYNSVSSSRPDLEWSGQTRYSDVRRNQSPAVLALAVPRVKAHKPLIQEAHLIKHWSNVRKFAKLWSNMVHWSFIPHPKSFSTCVSRANGTASCRLKSRKTSWPGPVFSQVVHETW